MPAFIFVHGGNISTETWNRLTIGKPVHTEDGRMGGKCWDVSIAALESHGYRSFAPTLSDEHSSSLSDHIGQICEIIRENDLQDVILVGHSYGGMIITGVAARTPERIRHMVYLDAALPDPGQSLFDLISLSGIDPLSVPGLEADPPYVEKLHFDQELIRAIPKTYIRCTKSDFTPVTGLAREKIGAAKEEWTYIELPSSHVPMADMPEEFNRILLEIGKG